MPETEKIISNVPEIVSSVDGEQVVISNVPEVVSALVGEQVIISNVIEIVYGAPTVAPTIDSDCPLPVAHEGVAYNFTFSATGGTPPYLWGIIEGTLPAGLTMSTGGVISGTPSESGPFTISVIVVGS